MYIGLPTVWNSLPSTLRSSQTLNTFRSILKPILSCLLLIAHSDLFWFILLNDYGAWSFFLLSYLLTYTISKSCKSYFCREYVSYLPIFVIFHCYDQQKCLHNTIDKCINGTNK